MAKNARICLLLSRDPGFIFFMNKAEVIKWLK
ncbi:hypothetical protein N752_28865 [Desulforamulus aquiferis]|nr:hypothetical protein N752_28865 [Desulforamulus aquiferis]